MRQISYLAPLLMMLLISCQKESYTNATIIKNCTGTYLKVLDKEYLVCGSISNGTFENGQAVLVSFKLTKECATSTAIPATCFMLYPNDGLVNIIDIKKL